MLPVAPHRADQTSPAALQGDAGRVDHTDGGHDPGQSTLRVKLGPES
jgi:hypothetical protein